jgi:hypothetical protein
MTATFLLGVGAQKAGTSWLHDYLAGHPDADLSYTKEYHALDGIFGLAAASPAFANLDAYIRHFTETAARPGVRLVADFTPAYAALPAAALAATAKAARGGGLHPRALFILRDPVERVWSAVRMVRAQGKCAAPEEAEDVRLRHTRPAQRVRGDYRATMAALAASFPAGDIYYGLYETLFRGEEIARLMRWLGLAYRAPSFSARINASAKTVPLPRDLQIAIARAHAPAYEAAAAQFGAAEISRLWPSAALL